MVDSGLKATHLLDTFTVLADAPSSSFHQATRSLYSSCGAELCSGRALLLLLTKMHHIPIHPL